MRGASARLVKAVARDPRIGGLAGARVEAIAGGFYHPREEVGDCNRFTQVMARRAEVLGVRFHYEISVLGLEVAGARVQAVYTSRGPMFADAYVAAMASHMPPLVQSRIGAGIRRRR